MYSLLATTHENNIKHR